MTFDAFNIGMFPAQMEPGIIMFEFRSGTEYPEIMAGRTIGRKRALVVIAVAGKALLVKPQIGG